MSVNLSPVAGAAAQFLDNSGNVLTGGKLYTYLAGTTTPAATYTSSVGVTFHSNPIILDAAGRVPAGGEIWLSDNIQYKFVLKDANDVLIATWDNLAGINSNFVNYTVQEEIQTATAGQTVFTLSTINYAPGTNSLSVFVDGVNQYDGVSYAFVETDSTTVTFTAGLHVGALVKFTTAVQTTGNATNASVVVYDPPFTGGVATTVEDKLAEAISVRDFGATSSSDVAEIQTAMAYAVANNKVIGFDFDATIRIPTDVPTLQQAVDSINPLTPNTRITLQIDAGHTLTSGILATAVDLSQFDITSQDAVVPCTLGSSEFLFEATQGAYHPKIKALFDLQGTGSIGVFARRAGIIDVFPGCGVINSGDTGAYAYRDGIINASRKHPSSPGFDDPCNFSGAANYCARSRRAGVFNGIGANLTDAGINALQMNYGGLAYISAADVSNAGDTHIVLLASSFCLASAITVSDGPLRSNTIPNITSRSGLLVTEDNLARGNWTPTIVGSTTAGTNTYVVRSGRWVIQNGFIHVWARIALSNLASVGTLSITGWPFPVGTAVPSGVFFPASVTLNLGGNLPAGEKLALRYDEASSFILRTESNTDSSALQDTNITNSFDMSLYVCYEVDIPLSVDPWN